MLLNLLGSICVLVFALAAHILKLEQYLSFTRMVVGLLYYNVHIFNNTVLYT